MSNLTIREYAKSRGISYESVRQQVQRHDKELKGHIFKENGKTILSDEAQNILNAKARKKVVVINDNASREKELLKELEVKDKEIENLKAEYEEEINKIKDKYNEKRDKIEDLLLKINEGQQEVLEAQKVVFKSQFMLEQKDEKLELIATNRKERRRYKKELKKKAKEEAKEQNTTE